MKGAGCEDLLQMHEAVAKTQRAEALAQQQADFQQSLRCWQRRLQLQAAQTKEEHNVQLKVRPEGFLHVVAGVGSLLLGAEPKALQGAIERGFELKST